MRFPGRLLAPRPVPHRASRHGIRPAARRRRHPQRRGSGPRYGNVLRRTARDDWAGQDGAHAVRRRWRSSRTGERRRERGERVASWRSWADLAGGDWGRSLSARDDAERQTFDAVPVRSGVGLGKTEELVPAARAVRLRVGLDLAGSWAGLAGRFEKMKAMPGAAGAARAAVKSALYPRRREDGFRAPSETRCGRFPL